MSSLQSPSLSHFQSPQVRADKNNINAFLYTYVKGEPILPYLDQLFHPTSRLGRHLPIRRWAPFTSVRLLELLSQKEFLIDLGKCHSKLASPKFVFSKPCSLSSLQNDVCGHPLDFDATLRFPSLPPIFQNISLRNSM